MDNPNPQWLADSSWDNITELAKLANFHGIIESFEQYPRDWFQWFQSGEPENTTMPGEWDSVNELQKMLIVRSLRSDRVPFCVTKFIINNLGSKFVEPPILDLNSVYDDSSPKTPIIFVLSPGVDPSTNLAALAEKMDFRKNFLPLSLGQGQAPIATQNIAEGIRLVSRSLRLTLSNCLLFRVDGYFLLIVIYRYLGCLISKRLSKILESKKFIHNFDYGYHLHHRHNFQSPSFNLALRLPLNHRKVSKPI